MAQATATSSGTLAGRQSYEETYGYDGIGNLKTARTRKDESTPGTWGTDLTDNYTPATASGGSILDQVRSIGTTRGPGSYRAASEVEHGYDAMNRLRTIKRGAVVETLYYGPAGELMAKQVGTSWTFWVGEYATVTATIPTGCGVSPCAAQNVAVDPVTRSELGYTNALRLSGALLHLKTRVYDPEMRIFLQVDSVDRQRYAYVRGNPQNYSDPTGMMQMHDRWTTPFAVWNMNGVHPPG